MISKMFSRAFNPKNVIEMEEDTFEKILKEIRLTQLRTTIQLEILQEELVEERRNNYRKLIDSRNETLSLIEHITSVCDEWKREGKVKSNVKGTCVLCLDSNPSCIAKPCNHLLFCRDCYDSVSFDDIGYTCPKCKVDMTHCEIIYT